ncbi:centrosomal protein of 152 kda-like [Plakobranchus ocellatus]|uniref:Centrosomal protein of 152 kDa-like n=1 Tax=Plakobranchus ocellatus TaxID=259542 RepID=A0AAV4ARA7_9GAST|nr:centrosomal protein of 152 kda-like [Plakobranchus ocellatus]
MEEEEVGREMEETEEEVGREKRAPKHRAAVAEGEATGAGESLKHSQRLLQQAKADHSEALGKIAALEKELSASRDSKEELMKKLTQAESTIETLTQHVTELSESDSVSRARREHEAVVSSLTQRHQREMLVVNEQLDLTRTELTAKSAELSQVREQLGEATHALEQAQVSRGETVNRLSRSLEESQRRCQELLEQLGSGGAAREVTMLKVKLEQSQESTRISEELCRTYQTEVKELKEQLSMLEAATTLGAFSTLSATSATSTVGGRAAQSADDSMTDLGIRRTLDFNSTPKSEERPEHSTQPPLDDDLVASLRSELERCLRSNREKRLEVTELKRQVKALTEKLEEAKGQVSELEKTCEDQKKRLSELGEFVGGEDGGVGPVEGRLRRDLDKLVREKQALLDDIKDYQQRLEEVGASEARLTEINAELSQQVSAMVAAGDQDKADALTRCQRTMEETGRITMENYRKEVEERHAAETEALTKRAERQIDDLKQQLKSALSELDDVKALYVNICQELAGQEAELTDKFKQQLEAETQKIEDRVELEKKEWREFIRDEIRKEEEEVRKAVDDGKMKALEAEIRAECEKEAEMKASQAQLQALQEQRDAVDAERQAWEKKRTAMETSLKEKTEEISKLSSELEETKAEFHLAEEKLNVLADKKTREENTAERPLDSARGEKRKEVADVERESAEKGNIATGEEQACLGSTGTRSPAETKIRCDKESEDVGEESSTRRKDEELNNNTDTKLYLGDKQLLGDANSDLPSREMIEDIERKLEEREQEIKRLTAALESGKEEVEEKEREMNSVRQKEQEALTSLKLREAEIVQLREKLEQQVVESAEEVALYKQKVEGLEAELEKRRAHSVQQVGKVERDLDGVLDSEEKSGKEKVGEGIGGAGMSHVSLTGLDDSTGLNSEQLRGAVARLQERLKVSIESSKAELQKQQELHRAELEKAARQREGKYQTELRYFLKEREEKGRARMDEALRDCEARHKEELGRVVRETEEASRQKFELSLREVRRVHEEEKKTLEASFNQRLAEERKRLRDEDNRSRNVDDEEGHKGKGAGHHDINMEEGKSLQVEVSSLKEKLRLERLAKEEKLRRLGEERDSQMVNMAVRHEKEEKALREKFEREKDEMKRMYEDQVKRLEKDLAVQERKLEGVMKELEVSVKAKATVEMLKVEAEVERRVEEKVRTEVEDRVRKEMEAELQGRVEEELKRVSEERKRMNEEFVKDEVEKQLKEKLQEERGKWFKDAEDYISCEVRRGVEDRVREEEVRRKEGFSKEVEDKVKWRLEEEQARFKKQSEERVKEKMEVEMKNLKRKFSTELGARIEREKSRLEQEVSEWKTKALKQMEKEREERMKEIAEEEREKWSRERKTQLERRVAEERKKLESELRKGRDQEILELRKELEEEMRKRIHKEKKEWEEEMKEEQERRRDMEEETETPGGVAESVSTEEKLKSEIEARTKACVERDKAVAFIRQREMSYREERQRLVAGLERCRGDLETMKGEHRLLEEKCTAMDRRYKEDMKNARLRRQEDLQKLRKTLEQEKEEAVALWEEKLTTLREEWRMAMEQAKSQGDLEKASFLTEVQKRAELALDKSPPAQAVSDTDSSTILELRDHYLNTVAKIKADVMSHVEEANARAAATMRAQIRKQRVKVVEEFKVKVKACLRAALIGQISEMCILSLENSIDSLTQQLISSTSAASSSSSSGNTSRSELSDNRVTSDHKHFSNAGGSKTSPRLAAVTFQDNFKISEKQLRGPSPQTVLSPRKNTVGVFDAFEDMWSRGDEVQKISGHLDPSSPSFQPAHVRALDRLSPQPHNVLSQLDKVDLFDSNNPPQRRTPTPTATANRNRSPARKSNLKPLHMEGNPPSQGLSDVYSPGAVRTPTLPEHELRPGLEDSPFVTTTRGSRPARGRDEDQIPAKHLGREAHSKSAAPDHEISPRDQIKKMEARARLANWARSGAAPWTSPVYGEGGSVDDQDQEYASDPGACEDDPRLGTREMLSHDGFRVPGPEAEKWVRSQKRNGSKVKDGRGQARRFEDCDEQSMDLETNKIMSYPNPAFSGNRSSKTHPSKGSYDQQERAYKSGAAVMAEDQFLSSDESVTSNVSHTSLVTLEPEEVTTGTALFKDTGGGGGGEGRRLGKNAVVSLISQNPVNSELPFTTRTVNNSSSVRTNRGSSPFRSKRSEGEEAESLRVPDYERIRAAVFQGAGGGKERIGPGQGHDLLTSSDDERSEDEFQAFPSKSADRARRGKFLVPTSTPLMKQGEIRSWSEGRADLRGGKGQGQRGKVRNEAQEEWGPDSWRHLGGHTFFESERLARQATGKGKRGTGQSEERESRRLREREPIPQQSGSLPQQSKARKSRDPRGLDGEDLVLRSAEHFPLSSAQFPSDLSRITQASGKEADLAPGMWRYRSLEDLIGGRSAGGGGGTDSQPLKIYKNTEEEEEEEEEEDRLDRRKRNQNIRSADVVSKRKGHESFLDEQSAYHQGGRASAPIQAMNSEFWERHKSCEEDEDEEEEEQWLKQVKDKEIFARQRKGNAKIQRSTSEQSLHTLRGGDSLSVGVDSRSFGQRELDGVDDLLAHYLSPARSSFDLRPFVRDEHF